MRITTKPDGTVKVTVEKSERTMAAKTETLLRQMQAHGVSQRASEVADLLHQIMAQLPEE